MPTADSVSRRPVALALPIALALFAPLLSAQDPRIRASTSIYDSQGVRLGEPVLSSDRWWSLVPLRFAGGIYLLTVNSLFIPVDGGLFFESSDCSGQAYVETATGSGGPTMWGRATILPPGSTLWAPEAGSSPVWIDAASGVSGFTGCRPRSVSLKAHPAISLVDLEQVLQPPFMRQVDAMATTDLDLARLLVELPRVGKRDP